MDDINTDEESTNALEIHGSKILNSSITTYYTDPIHKKLSDDIEKILNDAIYESINLRPETKKYFKETIEKSLGK